MLPELAVGEVPLALTRTTFSGIPIDRADLDGAVRWLFSVVASGVPAMSVRFVNAHSLVVSTESPEYREVLTGHGVNFPDGLPLAIALRRIDQLAGTGQVRGPSFFEEVLDRGRELGLRHFLLGGTAESIELLEREIVTRFPGALVVGASAPPFRPLTPEERAVQDGLIRASRPDVVWVGLGCPKQDFETQRLAAEVGVLAVGVGAAFDFLAGTKRAAPAWMRSCALEWLFRLLSEPRRLWRRYLVGNVKFAALALSEALAR